MENFTQDKIKVIDVLDKIPHGDFVFHKEEISFYVDRVEGKSIYIQTSDAKGDALDRQPVKYGVDEVFAHRLTRLT